MLSAHGLTQRVYWLKTQTVSKSKYELDSLYAKSTLNEIPHTLSQSGVKFPMMRQRSKTIFVGKFPKKIFL